jgi:hypothetical protein
LPLLPSARKETEAMSESKSNPTATGIILACLGAVFVGLWMVGQSVATEGEAIKNQLSQLQMDVTLLKGELRAQKAERARPEAAEPEELAAAPGQPALPARPAAVNEEAGEAEEEAE